MLSTKRLRHLAVLVGALATASNAIPETASNNVWSKFETTRQGMPALHQAFDVERHVKSEHAEQVLRYQVVLDLSQGKWREQAIGGKNEATRIYDGQDLLVFEAGGTEYTRDKKKGDKDEALPEPYETRLDWNKAKEAQSLPCGFAGKDHTCVIVDVPIKSWMRPGTTGNITKMTAGSIRIMIDTVTGIWLRCHKAELIETPHSNYQWDTTYEIKQMTYGADPNAALFKLPDGLNEVKEITRWGEARIRKQLGGKPAPELQVKDIHGKPISLAELKGKTILLDFWTTWCPPCQADAPSLEKLSQKYGDKNLALIGISVDEDRTTVEKYLQKHPHSFPVVLSSENQMPRPYEIGVFPTYLIIGPDGTLMTAEEGDKGFSKLRKELERAGLETE